VAVWLLFLVSEGDHCLNHVLPWVAQHQGTLSALLGKHVLPTHVHDDRLADCLTRLGTGAAFRALERDLNQQTVRVYQLAIDLVRIDTTTANSYAAVLSEQGLLQFGHSKDNPDLPQFKIAAAILGSFSPIVAFVIWNSPPMSPNAWVSTGPYNFILLTFVVVIAFAGVAANFRLRQLLRRLGGQRNIAFRVSFAWLLGNLFFGSQLSWILRPFIGSPGLPVEFLRATAFKGNFYEAVFHTVVRLFTFD